MKKNNAKKTKTTIKAKTQVNQPQPAPLPTPAKHADIDHAERVMLEICGNGMEQYICLLHILTIRAQRVYLDKFPYPQMSAIQSQLDQLLQKK